MLSPPNSTMKSQRLTLSLVALCVMALIAVAYAKRAHRAARFVTDDSPSASSHTAGVASTLAPLLGKDICAQAADRCKCAADHGAQLLAACFPDRALQLLSRAPATCAASAFLGVKAEALAALERREDAAKAANRALESDPNNRVARRALAIVAIQAGDFSSADSGLSKLIAEDGRDADSLFYSALSQRRRNRYNAAREGFLAVLRLDAHHIDARFNLVTLTAAAGADQEADHHYQELLQIAPAGDPRLIAARSALRATGANKDAPVDLPVFHQSSTAPSGVPSH